MSATVGSRIGPVVKPKAASFCPPGAVANSAAAGASNTVAGPLGVGALNGPEVPAERVGGSSAAPGATELRLSPAGAGDHYGIFDFLVSIFRAPSSSEFQAQLEEPWYEPTDRFLVKHGTGIVGHVRLSFRELHFGSLILPSAGLAELATASPYRRRGVASALVAAAETRMRERKAVLGFVRTTSPELFARQGWVVWGRHSYSIAGTRDILAQWSAICEARISSGAAGRVESRPLQLSTRIWRHVERGALTRLYAANTHHAFGPPERTEDYWRWLVSRRGYDSIYVAIEGRDKLGLDETPIIGYAVTKAGRIVEMMTDPNRPYAIDQLIKRVCGDAMERDIDTIRLDAPPDEPLHRLFADAGGQFRNRTQDGGQVMMAKLFDPIAMLERLEPTLLERLQQAQCELPAELGILTPHQRFRLILTRRQVRIEPGRLGRGYLTCQAGELTQLLLGQTDIRTAVQEQTLSASSRGSIDLASVLFPRVPFWRPPWDELPA